MHIPTHMLSGWCAANLPRLAWMGPKQRFCAILAAIAPDIDGIGWFWSHEAYERYHHILAHNIFFGVLSSAAFAVWARIPGTGRGWSLFGVYLALFHLHLLMDAFGSGPGWPITYGWPLDRHEYLNPWAWPFDGWQNYLAAALMFACTGRIYRRRRRGPLEYAWPYGDRAFLHVLSPREPR